MTETFRQSHEPDGFDSLLYVFPEYYTPVNTLYEQCIWEPQNVKGGVRENLQGHLLVTEIDLEDAANGRNVLSKVVLLEHYLTICMALKERECVGGNYGAGASTVLLKHEDTIRRHLGPYFHHMLMSMASVGTEPLSIAGLSCLLNELGGAHSRGSALIGWSRFTPEGRELRHNIQDALVDYAGRRTGYRLTRTQAAVYAEVEVWQASRKEWGTEVTVLRAERLLAAMESLQGDIPTFARGPRNEARNIMMSRAGRTFRRRRFK